MEDDYPEVGELVIIKIKKVFKYGAFAELEEYPDLEGYIPIGEVASRWIKNIHEFISVGQRKVARVYRIDLKKQQIDLSLKRVSESDKKRKMEEVRKNTRAMKLFDVAAKNANVPEEDVIKYIDRIVTKYGDIYSGMVEISEKKEKVFDDLHFPKKLCDELIKIASENMKRPEVKIDYFCYIKIYEPNGVEYIKKLLTEGKGLPKGFKSKITYFGAPKYKISFIGQDYKSVDKTATEFFSQLEKKISKYKHEFSYEQIKK